MAGADGVRCMLLRGGTSKGAYFVAGDVPPDADARDDLLLRIMGSPDARQIDGLGGAHPLTSKVAIVSRSSEPDVDVDVIASRLTLRVERCAASWVRTRAITMGKSKGFVT